MSTFQRGQKSKISDLTGETTLTVGVNVGNPGGFDIDISCFGLDAQGKLSDDAYFQFYNQPKSPCGNVEITNADGFDKAFKINLGGMPSKIQKLVFAATIDGNGTMSGTGHGELALLAGGNKIMTFPFQGNLFGDEKALMIAEVYNKTVWRVAAVGQGFNGGLAKLLEHFGGEVADDPAPSPAPSPPPKAEPPKPKPKLSLGKITLEKRGQSQRLSLEKKSGENVIHINLNWDAPKKKWWGGGGDVDLDLGCMFEMRDGMKGVIQPLGERFGARHMEPYIQLDKDDRSGMATDGENMRIYRPDLISRVVIFAMIYEGTANFATVNGRVTVKDTTGSEVTVHCDAPDPSKTFCAVALIDKAGDDIRITKEERYFPGHMECDFHYGFGFRWVAGSK